MKQEVDLIRYLPGFLQGIREFQALSKAENPEFGLLYGNIDALLNNGFIHTADLQGIKRWEQLLGITAPTGSTEGRRAALLGKWNRTIPYTMARLYEYLDALTARENYHISFPAEYQIEFVAEDLPLHTIRAVRSLILAMLPANMLFILADRILESISIPVDVQSGLRLRSVFYPRYNTPPFYLDGSVLLDGTYRLNGYLSGETLDFYPAMLRMTAGANWRTGAAWMVGAQLLFRPEVQLDIETDAALRIWGVACAKAQTISQFFLQGNACAETRTGNQLTVQGAAEESVGSDVLPQIIGDAEVGIAQEGALRMGAAAGQGCGISTSEALTVEKDLWRLDGSVMLDGSRMLDAEIYEEKI